jgi:hypothetical protein
MLVSLTQSGLNKINASMFVVDGNPEEGFEMTKDLIFMLGLAVNYDFYNARPTTTEPEPIDMVDGYQWLWSAHWCEWQHVADNIIDIC